MMCLMLVSSVVFTACSEEDLNTDQYQQGVHLNVYGPTPVMRGGQLRFLGSNLDQVAQVIIPGVDPITNIEVVKAGVPSEIRITVPHDGPEPGLVTLVTRTDEKIQTLTPLNFTEPIEIESFSPAGALPGENVTITGDYLNLIHAVGFADNVVVGEEAFVEHDRYHIILTVPEEARTGKLSLYDLDITALEDPTADVTYNIILTDEAFTVGTPNVAKLASPRGEANALGTVTAKLGETVTITGANYQLVESLTFGDTDSELGVMDDFKGFTASKDGKTLTFALPAEAPDGDINIICKSGVAVPVGKLVTVAPTELAAAPAPVKAGNTLTITGKDLDVVVKLQFPNCDAQDVTIADGKIAVQVPATAQEGDIQLIMANGKKTPVAFTLVKPEVTGFNMTPAAAGSDVELQGTNLDLVKSVAFAGGSVVKEVTANAEGTVLTVKVPLDAESGALTLGLENGTTVETMALEVSKPVFCYIPDVTILTENDLKAGDLLLVEVENADKLTEVQIDGEKCQYVINGKKLYIGITENAGTKSVLKLISSNGDVEYALSVIPNTEKHTVIWSGAAQFMDWNGNQDLAWGGYDWSLVTPGTELCFSYAPVDPAVGWGCISLRHGDGWANLPEPIPGQYNIDVNGGPQVLVVELTETILADLVANGGLVITGHNYILSQVELVEHISLETTLWQGEAVADDWGNQPTLLSDGCPELIEAGAKVGQTLRFYIHSTDAGGAWNLQVIEGHWGPQYCDLNQGNYDLAEHNGAVEIVLTEEILNAALTPGGWGGGFILNGDNVVCTKLTIE